MKTTFWETLFEGIICSWEWLFNERPTNRGSPTFPRNFDYPSKSSSSMSYIPQKPRVQNPMQLNLTQSTKEPTMAKNRIGDMLKSLESQALLFKFMDDIKSGESTHLLLVMDALDALMKETKAVNEKTFLFHTQAYLESILNNHYLTQEEALKRAQESKTYQSSLLYLHREEISKGDSGKEYYTLTSAGWASKDILCVANAFGYVTQMPEEWKNLTSVSVPLGRYVNNDYKGERTIIDGLEMGTIQLFPNRVREMKANAKKKDSSKKETPALANSTS